MAMLDILNVVWRKKGNWSQLLVQALRQYHDAGGAVDAGMIDTMEVKTSGPPQGIYLSVIDTFFWCEILRENAFV